MRPVQNRSRPARRDRCTRRRRLWRLLVLAWLLWFALGTPAPPALAQQPDAPPISPQVTRLMEQLTTLEKVGQLFLVTFSGADVSAASDVAYLIQRVRVGGVVLSPANGNFVNNGRTPERLHNVVSGLQTLALSLPPLTTSVTITGSGTTPIPLLIAMNQEGDDYPYSDLWNGATPLPDAMALGATWNPAHAEQIGVIVGRELSAAGVNLLLGPSLDVLDKPRPASPGSLGTRSFGGDPYWVSQFGRAYIRGVHAGSGDRLLTVAKHFPGLGGADRNPIEELPTIQKSLETLRSIELVPFFAVTALSPDDPFAATDALMTSHVRYRGFQGNIRQLSRPISLDAQNLPTILALPEFAPWRNQGGLLVSQELGAPSIRKFYDPALQTFPAKRIAQEAFLAGNDLLLLSRFDLVDDWPAQLANIEATVLFFRDKYETDPTFKSRVDLSVARILQRKLDLYGAFALDAVLRPAGAAPAAAESPGYSEVAQVAQDAVTLIYPSADELSGRLPGPPLTDEQILIITDDRRAQECSACVPFYVLYPKALEELMLKLYGPDATGQITDDQIGSMTFHQLKRMLTAAPNGNSTTGATLSTAVPRPRLELTGSTAGLTAAMSATITPTPTTDAGAVVAPVPVSPLGTPGPTPASATPAPNREEELIRAADWIIFAMLDVNSARYPDSDAVSLFLRERSDSLQGKRLIVLAFNAPYFLDATEVSKLTAYYALYSRTVPFQEAAVRLLFQEFQPRGAPPVDVDAIGYLIIEATRPDPNQVINIDVVTNGQTAPGTPVPTATPQLSPEGTPIPIKLDLKVGDVLTLRTSRIVDRNGRPVPDGTPVEFRLLDTAQSLEARLPLANTVNGVATANFNLDRSGTWQITAASDTAQRSVRLIVTIPEEGMVEVGIDRPTATPTAVPTPTPSPTPSPTITPLPTDTPPPPTATATALPDSPAVVAAAQPGRTVGTMDLLLSVIGLVAATAGAFRLRVRRSVSASARMKRSLVGAASGLVGYVLFAIGWLPVERIPFVARAVHDWLPYEVLPLVACLVFFALGWWLTGIAGVRRVTRRVITGRSYRS